MAIATAAWRAEVRRVPGGAELLIARGDAVTHRGWWPSVEAALASPQARAFAWRWSGAIGSAVLYRGDLDSWTEEAPAT